MNTANLQLEGLLIAVANLNALLVRNGLVSAAEIDEALHRAEASLTGEDRSEELSPANRDAVVFPVRLLRMANGSAAEVGSETFSSLTRAVGQRKEPYNDQR